MNHESVASAVPTVLRPYVTGLVGYRISGAYPGIHLGLPSPDLTLVIPLDDGVRLSGIGIGETPRLFEAVVAGLHPTAARIHHDGSQFGLQLSVTPLGARVLLRSPAAQFASGAVTLEQAMGARGVALRERALAAGTWRARFAVVLSDVARSVAAEPEALRAPLQRAWDLLALSQGAIRIDDLARDVGWSARHLTASFAAEFGPTPKLVARVHRFHRSRRLVGRVPLTDIAVRCGYADQSHLVRDWRQFAGTPPTRWLRDDAIARVG
ncbi:MAG: helix-turn-helix domain-containing protein [Dermatophilaceae bacterium]